LGISEAVKKVEKLALLIMSEDKSDKQKIKLLILFHWQPNQNFPQIWSFAVNRFEVIKNTFQFSCD